MRDPDDGHVPQGCTLGHIRLFIEVKEDQIGRGFLYYFVDDVGRLVRRDDQLHLPVPPGLCDYVCLECAKGFMYWQDVDFHLNEDLNNPAVLKRKEQERRRREAA